MIKECCKCQKKIRPSNTTGYCWSCFRNNEDGIRTKRDREYREKKGLINKALIHTCVGCKKSLKKGSKTGYCGNCFHTNVDGIKVKYSRKRWRDGFAKLSHWKGRGVDLINGDIERHDAINCCEICQNVFSKDKVLDHCHKTRKYRGTLCRQCNAAIGKLGDCLDLVISRISRYKEQFDGRIKCG
jgi:hypothetical protein